MPLSGTSVTTISYEVASSITFISDAVTTRQQQERIKKIIKRGKMYLIIHRPQRSVVYPVCLLTEYCKIATASFGFTGFG